MIVSVTTGASVAVRDLPSSDIRGLFDYTNKRPVEEVIVGSSEVCERHI